MSKEFEEPRLTQAHMAEIAKLACVYKITDHDDVAIAIRDLLVEIARLKLIIKGLPPVLCSFCPVCGKTQRAIE